MRIDYSHCPYCGAPTRKGDGSEIWGSKYRGKPMLLCTRFPRCDTYVSIHTEGIARGEPMGTMANESLRSYRRSAHRYFDPLWKSGLTRDQLYLWLSSEMGIPFEDCHIAKMDEFQCQRVVDLCRVHLEELGLKPLPPKGKQGVWS